MDLCGSARTDKDSRPLDRDHWLKNEKKLAESGLRVLAIARKEVYSDALHPDEIEDLTSLGLVGMQDPPREDEIFRTGNTLFGQALAMPVFAVCRADAAPLE